jgi:tetratricopeptide (TPR) repeat protein
MLRTTLLLLISFLMVASAGIAQSEKKSVRQGNREFKKGEYLDSEISYKSALELNPSSVKGNFNLGDALYKQEKFEDAAKIFEDLSSLNIDSQEKANIYHNLGNTYFNNQKFAESIEAYKNALRNNPSDTETKYNLAQAQRMLSQQEQQQDQKGDGENDENKDENKDDDQDKKQDQNQEDKQDNKDQQDKKDKKQDQEQQISPEDARRMLEAIQNNEQKVQDRVREEQAQQAKVRVEKNW